MLRPRWVAAVIAVLIAAGTYHFFANRGPGGDVIVRASGDGRYYWAYVTSLVLDRDVDFANQYDWTTGTGNPWHYGKTETGHLANPFPIGPALLWTPFFLIAHGVSLAVDPPAAAATGNTDVSQAITLYGSFVYGVAAGLLAYAIARRRYGPGPALAGAFVGVVCGPLLQYILNQPSFAHAPSAFVVALLLYVWDRGRGGERSVRGWIALGALIGLAMDVRGQNIVFALPVVVEGAVTVARKRSLRALVPPAAGAAAALVAFAPQMLAWKAIYGYALGVPQSGAYMHWGQSLWPEVLFSSRNGLFPYAPLWAIAALGLITVVRRDRGLGLALIATGAISAYVNGAVTDWWAIGSIGARRFDGLVVHAAVGFAAAVAGLVALVERRPRLVVGFVVAALLFGAGRCHLWMTQRFTEFERHGHEPDSRDMVGFYDGYFDKTLRAIWGLGNPLSWPAAWAFSWRTGMPAAAYDTSVGPYLLVGATPINDYQPRQHHESGELRFGDGRSGRFLISGFGATRKEGGRTASAHARFLLAVNNVGPVKARLTGVGLAAPSVRIVCEGRDAGQVAVQNGQPFELRTQLPTHRGVNVVDLVAETSAVDAVVYTSLVVEIPP